MLCAVCMPEFCPSELAAIEALRLAHDPAKAGRIGPHVTLVFPTQALPQADLIRHVGAAAASFGEFDGFGSARELSGRENAKVLLFAGRVSSIDVLRIEPHRVHRVHSERLRGEPL